MQGATGVAQTGEELPDRPLLARALLTLDCHEDGAVPAGAQFDAEASAAFVDLSRRRIKPDGGAADDVIETAIREDDAALVETRFGLASPFPTVAAKLKDISEVGREVEYKLEDLLPGAEVAKAEPLIARARPEKLRADDLYRVSRKLEFAAREKIGVGQIRCEQRIVVLDIGAEQERPLSVDQDAQIGKVAGVLVKEAFGIAAAGGDVAVMVEHGERIVVLEGSRATLQYGSRCRDVEGVGDCFGVRGLQRRVAAQVRCCQTIIPCFFCSVARKGGCCIVIPRPRAARSACGSAPRRGA